MSAGPPSRVAGTTESIDPAAYRDPQRFIDRQLTDLERSCRTETRRAQGGVVSTLTHFRVDSGLLVQRRTFSQDPWLVAQDSVVGIDRSGGCR